MRLALVEAGKDWRSLNDLAIEDGYLRDLIIVPEMRNGVLGVREWDGAIGTVAGESLPTNGAFSIADPRAKAGSLQYQQYGVRRWNDTSGAVIGVKSPGQGTFSVADPRRAGSGFGKYQVTPYGSPAGTVIAGSTTGQGAFAVQDPRPGMRRTKGDAYLTGAIMVWCRGTAPPAPCPPAQCTTTVAGAWLTHDCRTQTTDSPV